MALINYNNAKASHIMGSDITYQCLGNHKYEITLKVYRDCIGVILGDTQLIKVDCASINWSFIPKLFRKSITDITGLGKYCTQSRCGGGTFPYGIEEHIYKGVIDLSGGPFDCTEYTISWAQLARNNAITTGAKNERFYTQATIFTDLDKCNSSPIFTTPATALVCANSDFVFNNGAVDSIDNDILTYSFIDPLSDWDAIIEYNFPFSSKKPLTFLGFPDADQPLPGGFHLDAQTGNINFRPTTANQVTVMVLEVTEWRMVNNAVRKVGITRRDIQVNVINCNNNTPPVIAAENDTVCAGDRVCIPIGTFDADQNDSVWLEWNGAIKGATFTKLRSADGKRDSAVLCWTPKQQDTRLEPYLFTVTAKDNACPLVGRAVKAVAIYVAPFTAPNFSINNQEQCFKTQNFDFVNTTVNKNGYSYKWTFTDGREYQTTDLKNIKFNNAGYYEAKLTLKFTEGCERAIKKSLIVKPQPSTDMDLTGIKSLICLWPGAPPLPLQPVQQGGVFSGKNISNNVYTPKNFGPDTVQYHATINGCTADTVLYLSVQPKPQASFTVNAPDQCIAIQSYDFTNTSAVQVGGFESTWLFSDGQVYTGNAAMTGIKFAEAGNYTATLVALTTKGCADSAVKPLTVHPEPTPDFLPLRSFYCTEKPPQELIPVQAGGFFEGKNVKGNLFTPSAVGNDSVTYRITSYGCYAEKTRYTSVITSPKLNVPDDIKCFKHPVELDAAFPDATYLWQDGSTLPTYTVTDTGKYRITLYHICDTLEKEITVGDCYYGAIPNCFSPNGDGLNDVFLPFITNADSLHLEIFSRWGQKMFESNSMEVGWDGTYNGGLAPDGTYMWLMRVEYRNEKNVIYRDIQSGNLTLMR